MWLKRLPRLIGATIFRYPMAFVAVARRQMLYGPVMNASAFAVEPRVPPSMAWIGTNDNSLWGDGGWRTEHHPSDYMTFMSMVKWLWRNGGHDYAYADLGCPYVEGWHDTMRELYRDEHYWKRPDGYWLYRRFIKVGNRYVELFFGWNLFGNVGGRCKMVCSVRIKSEPGQVL